MYIETSAPRKQGDKARLLSEEFSATTFHGRCVKFWYHMYGATIGTLRVLVKTGPGNQSETAIWELSGNFGDQWYSGQAPVSSGVMYQVTLFNRKMTCFESPFFINRECDLLFFSAIGCV